MKEKNINDLIQILLVAFYATSFLYLNIFLISYLLIVSVCVIILFPYFKIHKSFNRFLKNVLILVVLLIINLVIFGPLGFPLGLIYLGFIRHLSKENRYNQERFQKLKTSVLTILLINPIITLSYHTIFYSFVRPISEINYFNEGESYQPQISEYLDSDDFSNYLNNISDWDSIKIKDNTKIPFIIYSDHEKLDISHHYFQVLSVELIDRSYGEIEVTFPGEHLEEISYYDDDEFYDVFYNSSYISHSTNSTWSENFEEVIWFNYHYYKYDYREGAIWGDHHIIEIIGIISTSGNTIALWGWYEYGGPI